MRTRVAVSLLWFLGVLLVLGMVCTQAAASVEVMA